MNRTRRWLLNALTFLSLLFCIGSVPGWVRSFGVKDIFFLRRARTYSLASDRGAVALSIHWCLRGLEGGPLTLHSYAEGTVPPLPLHGHDAMPLDKGTWIDLAGRETPGLWFHWHRHPTSWGSYDNGGGPVVSNSWQAYLQIPWWSVTLAAAVLPLLAARRRWILRRRRRRGLCQYCGYDLRATPNRCPECGVPVDLARAAPHRKEIAIATAVGLLLWLGLLVGATVEAAHPLETSAQKSLRFILSQTPGDRPLILYVERIHDFSGSSFQYYVQQIVAGLIGHRGADSISLVFWPNETSDPIKFIPGSKLSQHWDAVEQDMDRRIGTPDVAACGATLKALADLAAARHAELLVMGDGFFDYTLSDIKDAVKTAAARCTVDIVSWGDDFNDQKDPAQWASGYVITANDDDARLHGGQIKVVPRSP